MRWPILLASAALALAPVGALAHGGGLDASGCHNNSKTGKYHCHGGGGGDGGGGGRSIGGGGGSSVDFSGGGGGGDGDYAGPAAECGLFAHQREELANKKRIVVKNGNCYIYIQAH
jgi:hypothetical protein